MMGLFANLCCNETGSVKTKEKSDVAITSNFNRCSLDDTCKNLSNADDDEFSADDGLQQNEDDDGSHLNLKLGTHDETPVEESSERMNHDSMLTEKLTQTDDEKEFPEEQVVSDYTKTGEQTKISVDEHGDMTLEPKTNSTQVDHHINGKESFSTGISSSFCEASVEHAMTLEKVFVDEQFNPCASDNTMDVMKDDQGYEAPPVKSSSSLDQKPAAKDKIRTPSVEQATAMMNKGTLQEQDNDEKKDDATVDANETLKMPQDNTASKATVVDVDEVIPESDKKLPVKANPDASPTLLSTAKDIKDLSLEDTHVVTNMQTDYPLDGKWVMIWKLHPENPTTFELRNHTFYMMGCPCELIWKENSGGISSASFQWPSLVSEYPVFQESKKAIPTGATCIEWTTSDSQYGDVIWKRLDSKGCKQQPEEKEQSPKVLEAPAYPLDGNWVLTWKSYYLEPSLVIVHNHQLELFDCRCEIKLKAEDDYRPSVQWPVAIFSEETPIFQKGKHSIPKDLKVSELPNTIEWTITDKQYGELIWTRLNEGDSISSHTNVLDRKRKSTDDEAILMRRKEEEKRMKSSTTGKAWDLVKGLIKLSEQLEEVEMIDHDDVIYLAERLLRAQRDFKERNYPSRVDIAYHHTESWNLETIKTNGLLSRGEREQRKIHSNFNGSAFGDGIYCSGDPVAYAKRRFGDTTILLARMKGIESSGRRSISDEFNTSMYPNFCVLKCCNQCIPLFKFKSKLLGRQRSPVQPNVLAFCEKLAVFQQSVQELLDSIINETVNDPANVAWLERLNSLNSSKAPPSFKAPPAFSYFSQIPLTPVLNFGQFPCPSPATALDAKDIQDCNSTEKLIDFIRNNKSKPFDVQAAKKRLMTISPEAYAKIPWHFRMPPKESNLFWESSSSAPPTSVPSQPSLQLSPKRMKSVKESISVVTDHGSSSSSPVNPQFGGERERAPLSPPPAGVATSSDSVPHHRPLSSNSSVTSGITAISGISNSGSQPSHYRMLTSTAAERKRTVAACRALRAQITRFEEAFIQLHGRPPKGAAERAPLATTYAQYREWKRAIRADAACRIQALFRGASTRWMLLRSNNPEIARIIATKAGRRGFVSRSDSAPGQTVLDELSIPAEIGEGRQQGIMSSGGRGSPGMDMQGAGQPIAPQWGGEILRRRAGSNEFATTSPIPRPAASPVASSSSRYSDDLARLSLPELQARKRELKQQLKQYDMSFARRHGRMPVKAEKEPIRHLYERYNALKGHIGEMEQEGRRSSSPTPMPMLGSTSPGVSSRVAVSPVGSDSEDSTGRRSGSSSRRISSSSNPSGVPPQTQDLATLKAEKSRLHQMLRSFERDFFRENQRQVQSFADIRPVASQYRRYKEIKRAMKEPQKHAEAIAVLKKYGGVVVPPLSMNENGSSNSGSSGSGSGRSNDPEWKVRIRHKQQRLLLLRHASRCHHEDGRCPVTPHCADMKRLWRHVGGCKDNQCRVPHCFSSRAILKHYRRCKDSVCPKCGPTREAIRCDNRGSSGSGSRNSTDQNVNEPTPASNSSLVQQNQLLVQPNIESIRASHPPWAYPTPFAPGQSSQTLTNEMQSRTLSSSAAVGFATTDDQKFRKPNLTYMQLCSNCTLCGDALKGKIIQLNNCDHCFHQDCILKSIQTNSCCPACSVPIGNTPG